MRQIISILPRIIEKIEFLLLLFIVTTLSIISAIEVANGSNINNNYAGMTPTTTSTTTIPLQKSKVPINHVIVIIQSGRSFDHYFGTYSGANGLSENLKVPVNPFDPTNKEYVEPFHLESPHTTMDQ